MSHRSYTLICPACGAHAAPEMFLSEICKRKAILQALQLPHPLALQVQAYVGLFRPPSRAQSIDRVEKLLSELLELISAGTVTRDRRTLPCSIETWKAALDVVLETARNDKLTTPLKDHGYLLAVALSKADETAAAEERRQEEIQRNRPKLGPKASGPAHDPNELFRREMKRLGRADILEKLDGTKV